ncbi:MAG: hypothetical protein JO257_12280 [Deltaproteobacteria bacterium]|nr:hypothetical protein [Deltaproteobacteria bacterium]
MKRIAFAMLIAACGSKQPPTANGGVGSGSSAAEKKAEHDEMMRTMPAEMGKFHDVLAPRWHQAQGPDRQKDTCNALPDFHAQADALAKATPPATANADSWTAATRALVASVAALDSSCRANDGAQFESAFANVHEAFHSLMKAAGGQGSDQPKM